MNWTCPFCQRDQVVTDGQSVYTVEELNFDRSRYQSCGYIISAKACANEQCGEVTLEFGFGPGVDGMHGYTLLSDDVEKTLIRPLSSAKPQPPAVPQQFAKDYYEACLIRDLSPKASATLSRRALQGMIRDFCGISKKTLYAEIEALEKLSEQDALPKGVAVETIEAMHHIRTIGNIGAHMEADINVIVDVEPDEAQALIELIEMLFEDWYIERAERQKKLDAIKAIAAEKQKAKLLPPNQSD